VKVIIDVPATAKKKRMVTVALDHEDEVLMSFRPDCYYKLGEPIQDVVQGHTVIGTWRTYWCPIAQEWQV
jgi:hypothetical protein